MLGKITIPKPGKNHSKTINYSPISLLSSLSKIYKKKILFYLIENIYLKLRKKQFVFRQDHSSTKQLINHTDNLITCLKKMRKLQLSSWMWKRPLNVSGMNAFYTKL